MKTHSEHLRIAAILARQFVPNFGTVAVVAALLFANRAGALNLLTPQASNTTIHYQGRLLSSAGAPITGTRAMQFKLYSVPTGGTPLWQESHITVPINDGLFSVLLGSETALDISRFRDNPTLYLGITISGDTSELSPRELLASAPYALNAATVADGSISTSSLANNAVTGAKIADGAVVESKIGGGAVTGPKLADGSVTAAKLGVGSVTTAALADNSVSTAKISAGAVNSTTIADGSIGTADLADGAVTNAKLGSGAVNGAKIASGSIAATHLANDAVQAINLAANSVVDGKVASQAVGATQLKADAVTGAKILDGSVTGTDIADYTLGSTKINSGTITSAAIGNGEVKTDDIFDGAVTNAKLSTNAVDASKLADNAVTNIKILNNAVDNAKLADLSVTTAKLVDGAVTSQKAALTADQRCLAGQNVTITTQANYAGSDVAGLELSFTTSKPSSKLLIWMGGGMSHLETSWDPGAALYLSGPGFSGNDVYIAAASIGPGGSLQDNYAQRFVTVSQGTYTLKVQGNGSVAGRPLVFWGAGGSAGPSWKFCVGYVDLGS